MSLNKEQMKKVVSQFGKNLMTEVKVLAVYNDEWLLNNPDKVGTAGVIDTETTGICPLEDEIIELAIRPFQYNKETFEVIRVLDGFDEFQEPSSMDKLTTEIQALTHISPDMVKGQSINWDKANEICNSCDFLIAHNADFDKTMLGQNTSYTSKTKWYCSFREVDWFGYGLPNRKQEVIDPALALINEDLAFDFEAHRAINDVDSLLQIIINLDLLGEILEEWVDLEARGWVSKTFYQLYWKRNWFNFKSVKKVDEDGKWYKEEGSNFWAEDKFCVRRVKKSKVEDFKQKAEAKANFVNPKNSLSWTVVTDEEKKKKNDERSKKK